MNAQQLLQKIFVPRTGAAILTYESFLDLTSQLRTLFICQKKFRVLTNNLLKRYENPSPTDIPDYDSVEFQLPAADDTSYARFYCSPYVRLVKLCELLNALGLADYQRSGGESPSVFIRINNPAYLNNLLRKGRYSNRLLNDIYDKFAYSEKIFNHFFTTKMTDAQRWDFIEAYFLGASQEELFAMHQKSDEDSSGVSEPSDIPEFARKKVAKCPQDYLLFDYLDIRSQQFWVAHYATIANPRQLLMEMRKNYPTEFSKALRKFAEACPESLLYELK